MYFWQLCQSSRRILFAVRFIVCFRRCEEIVYNRPYVFKYTRPYACGRGGSDESVSNYDKKVLNEGTAGRWQYRVTQYKWREQDRLLAR